MRHIALPARRITDPSRPYTCTGLGDRIHSATIAWVLGPSTLHLTADKLIGGQFGNKPESWAEIVSLFPAGSVEYRAHPVSPKTEFEWVRYLDKYRPETYYYGDYCAQYAKRELDISPLLSRIPRITAEPVDIELPDKYVTVQRDANGPGRIVSKEMQANALKQYEGYMPIIIGGESKDDRLRWSLKTIAYVMSKAAFHVGVDSAFLHLAQLYMPCDRIHLFAQGKIGHHVKRAVKNGARLN